VETFYNTEQLVDAFPSVFSISSLKKSRMLYSDIDGPPYIRVGKKKVIYDHAQVMTWLASRCGGAKSNVVQLPAPTRRKPSPGRPTKAQEIAKRGSAG
jgi:hypothetical protein